MFTSYLYVLITYLFLWSSLVSAAIVDTLRPIDSERLKPCATQLTEFGPIEKMVWNYVCAGKSYQGPNKSKESKEPKESLNADFIVEILKTKRYRNAIPFHGINIQNMVISKKLDLRDAVLDVPLRIENSIFETAPTFESFKSSRDLSLSGSTFLCPDVNPSSTVEMRDIQIDGRIDLQSVTFIHCDLGMGHARVGGSLFLNGTKEKRSNFNNILISNSHVGEKLSLERATVNNLDVAYTEIKTNAKMGNNGKFNDVNFKGTHVGGDLDLHGAEKNSVSSSLQSLDLTGARVDEKFILGDQGSWKGNGKLNLMQAVVGAVSSPTAPPNSWPTIRIEGFTYRSAGNFWTDPNESEKTENKVRKNDIDKNRMVTNFKTWLALQSERQPYEQLGQVLKNEGYIDQANEILFAGREVELRNLPWSPSKIWLIFLDVFIGFGYYPWRSLGVSAFFIATGALVFRNTAEARDPDRRMPYGIAYSIDMLLPLIHLREMHYKIDLSGWQRYYFYFHKTMGYVLASFLIAGLSGLTK